MATSCGITGNRSPCSMSLTPYSTPGWPHVPSKRCVYWAKTWCCFATSMGSSPCSTVIVLTVAQTSLLGAMKAMGCGVPFMAGNSIQQAGASRRQPNPQAASCVRVSNNGSTPYNNAAACCLAGLGLRTKRRRPFRHSIASSHRTATPLHLKACGVAIGCKRLRLA